MKVVVSVAKAYKHSGKMQYRTTKKALVAMGSLLVGLMLLLMSAVLYSINRGTRYTLTHSD